MFEVLLSKSKVEWERAVIVDFDEYLSSSSNSNKKVLNSLRVIDLASLLLEPLRIIFLKVLIKQISKEYNFEASDFIFNR